MGSGLYPGMILLAMAAWGYVHSLLATQKSKDLARGWLGEAATRGYRLAYNLFSAVSFLPVLALAALLPDQKLYTIPSPWVWLTLALQAGAVAALLAGLRQTGIKSFLGLSQLMGEQAESQPRMIDDGLYRRVRHPLYTAGLVFIWLLPVMTTNILALNIGLSAYLVIGAKYEERKLVREFGQAYIHYRQNTPMLVPRLLVHAKAAHERED